MADLSPGDPAPDGPSAGTVDRPADDRSRPPEGPSSAAGRGGDRGQLILITGFVIAVTLVALALVLNSAIYTENLATRGESSGAIEAASYQQAVEEAAYDAFRYAHEVDDGDTRSLERNVTDAVAATSNLSMRHEVPHGTVANLSVVSTTSGTTIRGGDDSFTNATGEENWTVALGAREARAFHVYLDDRSVLADGGDDEFRIVANTSSERWMLNVSKGPSASGATVGISASGTYATCAVSNFPFWINVTDGTVGDEPCDAMTYAEGVSGFHDLRFRNGSAISGEYELVTDGVAETVNFADTGGPYWDEALFDVTVETVVWTPDLEYRTRMEIAPEETYD